MKIKEIEDLVSTITYKPGWRLSIARDVCRPRFRLYITSDLIPDADGSDKPKKEVKKVLHGWMNVYDNTTSCVYFSKKDADRFQGHGRIACVEINQEYEVEE